MQIHPSGTHIAGRYKVAGRPLMGGMGIVYLCFDHQEQRPVALKTFKPEFLPDRAARERFLQEGSTWVRLGKHPHIVRAYEVERIGDGREVYLVLELVAKVEGRKDASLRAWLTPGKPLPVDQALLIALQIVRGMRHAAETIPGFVHRDLKPENVLMGADYLSNALINRVRVTDFGLAKILANGYISESKLDDGWASRPGQLTQAGSMLGTPNYMAPEQWESAEVDLRADIYAFGCILGEAVSGHLLVQGSTLDQLRRAHHDGQAMLGVPVAASPAVRELLARCVAVASAKRYSAWHLLEDDLICCYQSLTGSMPPEPEASSRFESTDRVSEGWSYRAIGASYMDLGKAESALRYYERAHEIGATESDHILEITGLHGKALAHARTGAAEQAILLFKQALTSVGEIIHEGTGSQNWEAARILSVGILADIGGTYLQLGNVHETISFSEQALELSQHYGFDQGESDALGSLGIAYRLLGNLSRSIECHEKALLISRRIGDLSSEASDLAGLGKTYLELRDWPAAIRYFEEALQISRMVSNRRGEGHALGNLGLCHANLGDAQRAIDFYEQALIVSREIGDRRHQGIVLGNMGGVWLMTNNDGNAINALEEAVAIHAETGDRRGMARDLTNLGTAYLRSGQIQRADECLERALDINRLVGDQNNLVSIALSQAMVQANRGNLDRAIVLANEAARLGGEAGRSDYVQHAQRLVTRLVEIRLNSASSEDIVRRFMPVIDAAVAAAQGNRSDQGKLEESFPSATQAGWMIAEPIRRIWAGERNETTLTTGLNAGDALIVREILRRL